MAPVDRREHRQQRVRGAGSSSVQASFGFNFGALGTNTAKQSSLPPQKSSRRTPVQNTPRGANGSAQRHRSASIPRSSIAKHTRTPNGSTVTSQLGKRKRGTPTAQPSADEGDEDELSPNREELVRSVEQSRRVAGTISSVREDVDDALDELSVLEEGMSSVRKSSAHATTILNGAPTSAPAKNRVLSNAVQPRSPLAVGTGNASVASRRSISRRSGSAAPETLTPGMLANGQSRISLAARSGADFNTPDMATANEESEDELSPPKLDEATPRMVVQSNLPPVEIQQEDELGADELSSFLQPSPAQESPFTNSTVSRRVPGRTIPDDPVVATPSIKRGRPRKVVDIHDDVNSIAAVSPKLAPRGKSPKSRQRDIAQPQAPPRTRNPGKQRRVSASSEAEAVNGADVPSQDSLSTTRRPAKPTKPLRQTVELSDREELDDYEEPEGEKEIHDPRPQSGAKQPLHKQNRKAGSPPAKPVCKRQKLSGIKQAISVMRIKGSTVRGITVADTARTILEDSIDYRLTRMAEKLQSSQDSAKRKELRGQLNLTFSFKESLNEKLLDLQDANDVLSTNFKKMKLFKRDNAELRKEILTIQNNRLETALEHDDVQAQYDAEKARAEERYKLNMNMLDIEAAVHNGRKRAREEGREDEGPEVPLTMLLETVGRHVGSSGGGLLGNVKNFNKVLERAARWLERRA